MKKALKIIIAAALAAALLSACGNDKPPEDSSAEPSALSGTFSGEYGKMTFNGDGKSIDIDASSELSKLTGLPEGESSGSYVFIFRNESWRRDKAEIFRIILEGETYSFNNCPGVTGEDAVAFYAPGEESGQIIFRKD